MYCFRIVLNCLGHISNPFYSLVFESIAREEWYDMVEMVMKRDEGISTMRKQRNRPFTAYVANEEQQCLEEITFDPSQFSREHRADVSFI